MEVSSIPDRAVSYCFHERCLAYCKNGYRMHRASEVVHQVPIPTDLKVLELDLGCYELRLNGGVVRLEKIPMELFIFLVENRDKVVSRDAIVEHIWGKDVFLDTEQGINTAVRKIRQALH